MKNWIARLAFNEANTEADLNFSIDSATPPKAGDRIFAFTDNPEGNGWAFHSILPIEKVDLERSLLAKLFIQDQGKIASILKEKSSLQLESLWMSFSKRDRVEIKKMTRAPLAQLFLLSPSGAESIEKSRQFPLGTVLLLFQKHFDQCTNEALGKLRFPESLRGISKWEFAIKEVRDHIQTKLMLPAYIASQAAAEWEKIPPKISTSNTTTSASEMIFRGERGETNAGPARLGMRIDFALAKTIVEKWGVTSEEKSIAHSKVLDEIVLSSIKNQTEFNGRTPAFPGGLYDEL